MSKEKPEVGDVFEIPFTEYIVTALCISQSPKRTRLLRKYKYDFENDYTYDVGCLNWNIEPDYCRVIMKRAKYLGKSKVSIKELFDVAED